MRPSAWSASRAARTREGSFGLGFGLGAAGLGHPDGLLALGIVPRLLQGPLAGFGACTITRPPGLKLVLAVGSELLLPVTGHPAPDALRLGPADALAEPHAAVLAAGGAGPPSPLGALAPRASLLDFVFLFGHRGGERQEGEEGEEEEALALHLARCPRARLRSLPRRAVNRVNSLGFLCEKARRVGICLLKDNPQH